MASKCISMRSKVIPNSAPGLFKIFRSRTTGYLRWMPIIGLPRNCKRRLLQVFDRQPDGVDDGLFVKRRQIFRGPLWIRFGGYYPKYQLKLFKHSSAYLDDHEFDYRFYVNGKTGKLEA